MGKSKRKQRRRTEKKKQKEAQFNKDAQILSRANLSKEITEILKEYVEHANVEECEVVAGRIKCDSFGGSLQYYDNATGMPILEVRRIDTKGIVAFRMTKCVWGGVEDEKTIKTGNEEVECQKA